LTPLLFRRLALAADIEDDADKWAQEQAAEFVDIVLQPSRQLLQPQSKIRLKLSSGDINPMQVARQNLAGVFSLVQQGVRGTDSLRRVFRQACAASRERLGVWTAAASRATSGCTRDSIQKLVSHRKVCKRWQVHQDELHRLIVQYVWSVVEPAAAQLQLQIDALILERKQVLAELLGDAFKGAKQAPYSMAEE
jgi:hypothetical protein